MTRFDPRSAAALAKTGAVAIAVTATTATVLAVGGSPAGAATHQVFAYGGYAYGSSVKLGTLANVGKTAYTPMCTTHAGTTHVNKTAKLDLSTAGYIGAVTSTLRSEHHGATSRSVADTHTAFTSLLTGTIKLRAVTTDATVAHTGSKYSSGGNSTFTGLTVAGKSFPASPKANSSYSLPGLGSLTLNEQHSGIRNGIPYKTVVALDLKLGSNNVMGLPSGRIVVGASTATLRQTHRVPTGAAWATQVSVGSVVGSGRTAAAYTGCGGTGASGHSNDLAGVAVPNGVAKTGVAKSTVHTTDSAAKTTSTSVSRIAGVNLLDGMIKVKALTTRANAADVGGRHVRNATGTSVLGLVINGKSMAAPRIGQHRSIPGLGVLSFGYAHKSRTGIMVYGLRLVLGSAHNGVPAGAVITVGAARANVAG